jgi:hypothetical protein
MQVTGAGLSSETRFSVSWVQVDSRPFGQVPVATLLDESQVRLVEFGRRRLLALESLAGNGAIARAMPIPSHVLDDNADAAGISLAENVQREAMHPADKFGAFRALIESCQIIAIV